MIAELVVSALMAGGAIAAKAAAGEVGKSTVKIAFEALKSRLENANQVKEILKSSDIENADKNTLAQELQKTGALKDPETMKLLAQLLEALDHEAGAEYAIEGGSFNAAQDIIATHVEGLKNVKMNAGGNIDLSGARAPGK